MPRISGVNIPENKRGVIALTYIYGVGKSTAEDILDKNNIDHNIKVKDWSENNLNKIRQTVANECQVEGEVRAKEYKNIKRLKEIGSYRGIRHKRGLPVRGQQTQSNARTRKGPRKTVPTQKGGAGEK